MTTRPGWLLVGAAFLFMIAIAVGWVQLAAGEHDRVMVVMLVQGIVYAGAAWLVVARPELGRSTAALALVIGVGIVARAVILPLPPVSTDIFRYVWDGRVQASGVNPYRYVPADPALANLRDPTIFPNINRADWAVTIYPPGAQIVFLAVTRLAETVTAMKAIMVAFEALTAAALLGLLRARALPPTRILLYLWHPLPLWEIAGSGHVDAIAIGCMTMAMLFAERRRPGLSGAVLAFGAAVKFFPAFIAPAIYRRWGWRMPAVFALVFALCYLPYLSVGRGVIGFLGGYAKEEGLSEGGGVFWLAALSKVVPLPPFTVAVYFGLAAIGLGTLALHVLFRQPAERVADRAAFAIIVAVLVVVTPHYPWYLAWVVPFLCLHTSRAISGLTLPVFWLTLAAPFLYGMMWPYGQVASEAVLYIPAAILLLGIAAFAWRPSRLREIVDGPRAGHS